MQHAEIRHWKVTRIEQAEVDQMPFAKPDNFSLQTHLANSFGIYSGKASIKVQIRFDREVARYVQETTWHPSQQLKAQKDGSILASFVLNSTTEIKSWVMSFGCHAVVLEPSELRADIAQNLRQLLEHYDSKKIHPEEYLISPFPDCTLTPDPSPGAGGCVTPNIDHLRGPSFAHSPCGPTDARLRCHF